MNIIALFALLLTNFYSLNFQNSEGQSINMSGFQNKKVLLVNVASGSKRMSQLAELQQLQNNYSDSLVVILFPSNSFGKEPMNDQQIRQFFQSNYTGSFQLAAKSSVAGAGKNPIYEWVSNQEENGKMNLAIVGDFQKILIGRDGTIEANFAPQLNPLHPLITNAIVGSAN
jgi:glutathione peroxidase